ncbi:MAG: NAD(P)-binding domain-containing protein [Geopsychrobacter sp.]|nr:NAD(P)-binding domain-containing protein [Geopsychrobacter sp.]
MEIVEKNNISEHEQVVFCHDPASGLKAIVAIHNTSRGAALGGCRMWSYASEDEALQDVLRLSRGMTYKSAMAGLDLGGGKSVIIGNPHTDKNEQLLHAMGRFLNHLQGNYIAAEDSGTSVADLKIMAEESPYVSGITEKPSLSGELRNGDPSPSTAFGTFQGLRAAVKYQLQRDDLKGLRIAVQGLGNVGYRLAEHLAKAGARLWVCDIDRQQVKTAVEKLGATAVSPGEIFSQQVDIFAPCALGAVLNDRSIPQLKAKIVAGAANNQLAEERHGQMLQQHGILYAPDYVINAGGIIDIACERQGLNDQHLNQRLTGIYQTLLDLFARAAHEEQPTNIIANQMAEDRFSVH